MSISNILSRLRTHRIDCNSSRSYSLDFLKILATIAIVFHHFQQTTGAVYENSINFYGSWFYWGYIVELFFILSGYFLYKYIDVILNNDISLSSWCIRRGKRLLPMVAVSAIVYELILIAYKSVHNTDWFGIIPTIWGTIITALGIQEGWAFPNPYVNYPVWYISVLLVCYLLFYLLTTLAKKLKCSPFYFYIAIIILGCGTQTYGLSYPLLNSQIARGYYSFFWGLLLAHFIRTYGITYKTVISSSLILSFFTVVFVRYPNYAQSNLVFLLTFLVYPSIIILFETKHAKKIFQHKFWGVLGDICFNVYLWHNPMLPLMYTLMAVFNWELDFSKLSVMYLFLIASFAVGTASYYLLEKPLKVLVNKKEAELQARKQVTK